MPAYAVFEPPARANQPVVDHAARFVFLRDRFSWGAFLLGPFWMIWRRLWLVLIVYIVVIAVVEYALRRFAIAGDGAVDRLSAGGAPRRPRGAGPAALDAAAPRLARARRGRRR